MSLLRNDERSVAMDIVPTHPVSSALPRTLSIGQLAHATGETVKTLRYWMDRGLLKAERGENNHALWR
jgi:hypothetical protein